MKKLYRSTMDRDLTGLSAELRNGLALMPLLLGSSSLLLHALALERPS